MISFQQLDQLCQRHTEVSLVDARGEQVRISPKWRSKLPGDLRWAEQHLGPDRLEAVATPHPVGDLRHAVQRLSEGVRDAAVEVVENLRTPIIDGPDQV